MLVSLLISISFSYRVLEALIDHDANPCVRDHNGYCAVHYAALNGHRLAIEMVSRQPGI